MPFSITYSFGTDMESKLLKLLAYQLHILQLTVARFFHQNHETWKIIKKTEKLKHTKRYIKKNMDHNIEKLTKDPIFHPRY
jgi:hypothetical protein